MASTSTNQVQYIQLLNDSDIISIDSDDAEAQQVITNDEDESENQTNVDNLQLDDIQYLETEELNENDILIIHNDKQYIIPKTQLTDAENTIILEANDNNYETVEHQQQLENNEINNIYYSENEMAATQFVVLKDGKLHFDTDNKEIQQKLKDFQTSLTNFENNEEADEEMKEEDDEEEEEDDENVEEYQEVDEETSHLEQITGKNLLTGQTISLSGFLEKIRRKGIGDVTSGSVARRASSTPRIGCGTNEYVLIPPVNKKVVVGRTTDGKKLVGRVLQIQKKVATTTTTTSVPLPRSQRRPLQQQKPARAIKRPQQEAAAPLEAVCDIPPDVEFTELLDDNISRTLCGLMDLESVAKSIHGRQLIVKHAQRRSIAGKVVPGSRQVVYYYGRMVKAEDAAWNFANILPRGLRDAGIDLLESTDRQTVRLKIGEDGEFITQPVAAAAAAARHDVYNEEDEEPPVHLFLTVTVDEFNKKKTKVSIPQLAQNSTRSRESKYEQKSSVSDAHICQICGKKFQSLTSLRRHLTVHDPNSRPLQCLQCLSRFSDESSLKKHLILHTGLKPYTCDVCSKTFSHKSDLNFHLKIHNSEKKYKCQICLKSFHRHSNLLRHEEIHRSVATETGGGGGEGDAAGNHGDEDNTNKQPPYTCEICGVQYNFISSLTRHIVTHHINASDGTDT